jgi:hypothetical protein
MATTNIQTFSGDVDVTSNILMSGEVFIKTNDGNGKVGIGQSAGLTSQGSYAVAVGYVAGQTSQGTNAVAVGNEAGQTSQGDSAVAVGYLAGSNNQGKNSVAVGRFAGQTSQGNYAIAVGNAAGYSDQGNQATAVGLAAGRYSQGSNAIAVGFQAGFSDQGSSAVAVGVAAGRSYQGTTAVAVGYYAGRTSQGNSAVAVGNQAGNTSQGVSAVAVGLSAGNTSQGASATAVGYAAGQISQGYIAVAVGHLAGYSAQGGSAVAVGVSAGQTSQGGEAVALGYQAGQTSQGANAVAVGVDAGVTSQGGSAVAVGPNAGNTSQGSGSVAVGYQTGSNNQGASAVAVGQGAARFNQGSYATAVGRISGQTSQGTYAVAMGYLAGQSNQGNSAVAVGYQAGQTSQGNSAVAVGVSAGNTSQGVSAVAVGNQAGQTSQGISATALGVSAGSNNQGSYAVAVGNQAGKTSQGGQAVAVGRQAGQSYQGNSTVAVGRFAGLTSQGDNAVAVGADAGQTSQGGRSVAVGREAGQNNQGVDALALGYLAGRTSQSGGATTVGAYAGETKQSGFGVAVGYAAAQTSQGANATAVGKGAGQSYQGTSAVAVGNSAGNTSQGVSAVAVGNQAGQTSQGISATALGVSAGSNNQGSYAVAVGNQAGKTSQGNSAVAVGNSAGYISQGSAAVAVGNSAGNTSQGTLAVAVGVFAGQTSQGVEAIAMGYQAGKTSQGCQAIAVGRLAGQTSQGLRGIAIGGAASQYNQGDYSIGIGWAAGYDSQGIRAVAVGPNAGATSQGASATAVGNQAGETAQSDYATAVGFQAGETSQGTYAVAVGVLAGNTSQGASATALGSAAGFNNQGDNTVAVGNQAGATSQGTSAVAVGQQAGRYNQGDNAVAVGNNAGFSAQGNNTVAVGWTAGRYNQNTFSVAVGTEAGNTSQGTNAVAVGNNAGFSAQGSNTVAVGWTAGRYNQNAFSVAVGTEAGQTSQGTSAVAVGRVAGQSNQGSNAVAVGYAAGYLDQHDNSIVLNATGSILNTEGTGRTYIKPLRVATVASNVMTYDQATGEVMDSGGLISNKLAIVSEQPPSALTGATTVVDGHGRYKVTASSEGSNVEHPSWQTFNKINAVIGGGYSSDVSYATTSPYAHTGGMSLGGVTGEWVQLELPYKTKLRHISLQSRANNVLNMPGAFSIIGSNDNTSWTTLGSFSGLTEDDYTGDVQKQFVVNATEQYKYYAIVVTNVVGNADNGRLILGEWRLFTETFTVDAGVVSTTAASGLDVGYTEHPVEPMTDYKTYVEGHGTYEASASNINTIYHSWQAFDHVAGSDTRWSIASPLNQYNTTTGEWDQAAITTFPNLYTDDVGGTRYAGHWLQIKLPYAITLSHSNVHPTNGYGLDRAPKDGVILGSNDGEHWYKLTEFTGKAYSNNTWTRIDVNATTSYQYYRMCITKVVGGTYGSYTELTEWRLFAEKPVTRMENVHISGELSSETLQTGYIKWPKVPLKANDSEGYVASASSTFSTFFPWKAFDGTYTDGGSWLSVYPAYTENGYTERSEKITDVNGVDYDGEWIKIKLPQKIALHSYKLWKRNGGATREPSSGTILASNDDVNWYTLKTFTGLTYSQQDEIVDIQQSARYNHYALVIHTLNGGTLSTQISEIELFEAATGVGAAPTSAKLQVAGSLGMAKGAEFFAGDDVVMELPKHDRPLTKYPEVAMTADSSGGYSVNYSSRESATHAAYKAFDDLNQTNYTTSFSTDFNTFASGLAAISRTTGNDTFNHEYIQLNLPKPIHLKEIDVYKRGPDTDNTNQPKTGRVYGSNDGSTFDLLFTYSGLTYNGYTTPTKVINPNTTKQYYKSYRFVITEMYSGDRDRVSIGEMDFWGYEEGDTSVDVVHRSIPNKPGQQHLEVYWDANDSNSYSFANSSNVYDLSGNGVTGTITGTNGFDAEYNAWVFDGSGDYIQSGNIGFSGDQVMTVSFWFRYNSIPTGRQDIFGIGKSGTAVQFGLATYTPGTYLYTGGNDIYNTGYNIVMDTEWHHVVAIYTGGIPSTTTMSLYVDNVNVVDKLTSSTATQALNLDSADCDVTVGSNASLGTPLNGQISNFRLYSKVLNADQVRELYEYDAPRFGHRQNLVALHKGCLGVGVAHPTSRFEVAGADGVQEYPPRGITQPGISYVGYRLEEYIEGHGQYVIDGSAIYNSGGDDRRTWGLFDKGLKLFHGASYFTTGTPAAIDEATTTANNSQNINYNTKLSSGATIFADWAQIELPHKILLKRNIVRNHSQLGRSAAKGYIVASNDGLTFDVLNTIDDFGYTTIYQDKVFETTTNTYYRIFRILFTHKVGGDGGGALNMGEWRLFGTPAPSSLEDGHLTLGKALTLPRVSGHPAGAETPRAESLVVHYDTTVDSVVSGSTVVDTSGEGNNGTLTGDAAYSSTDRALTFDGSGDYVSGTLNNPAGAWVHSFSFWVKLTSTSVYNESIFSIGTDASDKTSTFKFDTSTNLNWFFSGNDTKFNPQAQLNTWEHYVCVYDGGNVASSRRIWKNGVELSRISAVNIDYLNLDSNASFRVANRSNLSQPAQCSISNFKLWDVALTAEEVAAEYALGRTGKSSISPTRLSASGARCRGHNWM